MSNTGTYKVIGGELVKISDRTPKIPALVYFPPRSERVNGSRWVEEFNDDAHPGGRRVSSKEETRRVMKELNLKEK